MLCPTCNTPNRDDAKFCKKCGHSFHTEAVNTLAAGGQANIPSASGEAPLEQTAAAVANPAYPEPAVATQTSEAPANDQIEAEAVSDVSLAPTLILTPEQMMAYHSRRWQQEEEREQAATGIADMPTLISTPGPADSQGQQAQDIADMPTVLDSPPASGDEAIPPPPSPPATSDEGDMPLASTEKDQVIETSTVATSDVAHSTTEEEASESMQPSSDQPDTAKAAADFSTLAVGATVVGRYEITQVVSESEQEHVYQVIDHEGYQRCWNCASEQNAQGDEFCMSCGAELLNAPYTMHEYPATASPEAVHLEATSKSDAGDVRRSEPNEDSTLVLMLQRVHESISEPLGVFIVADGLGGHDNGQVASR